MSVEAPWLLELADGSEALFLFFTGAIFVVCVARVSRALCCYRVAARSITQHGELQVD